MNNYKWFAFLAVAIALFVNVSSMGAVLISLKEISIYFETSIHQVSWLVIIHLLTVTAILLPAGSIADRFGHKKVHMFGLAFFILGTTIGFFSPNFFILIFSRVIMAIGSGMGQAVGGAIVTSLFPENERGKSLGLMSTTVGLGQTVGPVIGGVIVYNFGWQLVYLSLLFPMILAFILGYFLLRKDNLKTSLEKQKFDYKGTVYGVGFIIFIILGMKNLTFEDIFSNFALLFVLLSLPCALLFIYTEIKSSNPILNFKLFKIKDFSIAVNTRFFAFLAMSANMIMMPIFLTGLLNINESRVGLMLIFQSLGMAFAASLGGRLSDKFGRMKFIIFGLSLMIFSYIFISQFNSSTSKSFITLILLISGLGMGFWGSPNMALTYSSLDKGLIGFVSSIISFIRNMGNTFGQTLSTLILTAFLMIGANYNGDIAGLNSLDKDSMNVFLNAWKFIYFISVVFLLISLIPNIFLARSKQI
ncbi:MAG: hypothetical protein CL893_00430 [Dehalococcoidia bacterium]|nr:hypothetical protein [Dehalococcoidia bacterium]